MFKKLFKKISESIYDKSGKVSHTRISSYIILSLVLLSSLTFLIIDVINAVNTWNLGKTYVIPAAHITIFGMILTHHLVLLGIKKVAENKDSSSVIQPIDAEIEEEG